MKATPGPWAFAHESRRDQRFEVAQVENFRIYAEIFPPFPSTGRPEDDARLIAAAPLMLGVLQAIVAECEAFKKEHRIDTEAASIVAARAAIAAATGEQP